MKRAKILFLVSGDGGTLKFVFYALKALKLESRFIVSKVIGDRHCGAIDFARRVGLECQIIQYDKNNWLELYKEIEENIRPKFVITNIHKILDDNTISIKNTNYINLHYSLLPAYSGMIGMKTIEMASKQNVKFIGATTHFVTAMVDQGPIICQSAYPVNWEEETITNLKQIVFESACYCLLNTFLTSNHMGIREYKQTYYNPGLSFDPSIFDERFWNRIQTA
jgi:phosphoribosylglycinamide formyltransferase 1